MIALPQVVSMEMSPPGARAVVEMPSGERRRVVIDLTDAPERGEAADAAYASESLKLLMRDFAEESPRNSTDPAQEYRVRLGAPPPHGGAGNDHS